MMAYASGTFTAIKNTEKGRNLFRLAPIEKLVRGLSRESNGILDEAGISNPVFSAPGVSVALISSQCRVAGTIIDENTGRLFYVAMSEKESRDIEKLQVLGRVSEPFSTAPLGDAQVKGRFTGGDPLPNQKKVLDRNNHGVSWYSPPYTHPDNFMTLKSPGTGFATLIRDSEGTWWHRPIPYQLFHRSLNRNWGAFYETRPFISVEVAIVHSRLNGPCTVKSNAEMFDFTLARFVSTSKEHFPEFDLNSKQCLPFRRFFGN